jgi:hypothetical protein
MKKKTLVPLATATDLAALATTKALAEPTTLAAPTTLSYKHVPLFQEAHSLSQEALSYFQEEQQNDGFPQGDEIIHNSHSNDTLQDWP